MTRRPAPSMAIAAALVVLTHALWALALDFGPRRLRDPEYGKHLNAARRWEATGRPTALVLGSSRVAYGIRPAEALPSDPVPVNLALVGSGPVMQLMALRRALADGLKPRAVVAEYWPAFLRQDGPYREEARIDRSRLFPVDRQLVRDYFHAPETTLDKMAWDRVFSVSRHRKAALNQIAARWLPLGQRTDGMWGGIDETGWLVGHESVEPGPLAAAQQATRNYYVPLFQGYHVGADADRALGEIGETCRAAGLPLYLLVLPEAKFFTALMPPDVRCLAARHLEATSQRLDAPVIDARDWVPDGATPDGFHLLTGGAAVVSRRLGADLGARLP